MSEIRRDITRVLRRSSRQLRNKRSWDISQIADEVREFKPQMQEAKRRCTLPSGLAWYPYDSFSTIISLDTLLTGERRKLLALAEGYPVLDIGCGDGDLAFFFEHLGFEVHAMDHHATNYNGMAGLRALKSELGSSVEIHEIDLDKQFVLPRQTYSLALLFGLLYHLKNPFYVLEALALRAKYCLLSTRIAQFTPDHEIELRSIPMAYLLDDCETNNDGTNYWIFSEAGLKRLFKRTGWRVCGFLNAGSRFDSDPVFPENDERVFCLLESRYADLDIDARLAEGWHGLEGTFRWTARRFSFVVPRPVHAKTGPVELYFRFVVPEAIIASRPSVTLSAHVNGFEIPSQTYTNWGEHVYQDHIPHRAMAQEKLEIVFEIDDIVPAPAPDRRELGVFVPFDGPFPLIVG